MILTVYLDESGFHKGAPVMIMAGILGTETQWRHFQTDLDRLRSSYGFNVLHAKDLKARSGEFRGWAKAKALSLINELTESVSARLMEGATIEIDPERYAGEYAAAPTPKKVRKDTLYGLSFRMCLGHMICEVVRRFRSHKNFSRTRLHVVLERGSSRQGDAKRVFDEMKYMLASEGLLLLSDFTLATKGEAPPLMVADLLAFMQFQKGLGSDRLSKAAAVPAPSSPARRAGLTHLQFSEGGLGKAMDAYQRVQRLTRAGRSVLPVGQRSHGE